MLPQLKRKRSVGANTSNKKPRLERQNATVGDVMALQRQLRRLRSTEETKVQDWAAAGLLNIVGSYNTVESCCTRVAQGTQYFERIGMKINVTGILLKYAISHRDLELNAPTSCRVLLFVDKSPDNGVATCPALHTLYPPNGLLGNNTGNISTCNTFWPSRKRYKILYDKVVVINPDTVKDYDPVTGNSTLYFPKIQRYKKFIPLDLQVEYNNTTAVPDSVSSNNIWLWMGETSSIAPSQVEYSTRIYFKDA